MRAPEWVDQVEKAQWTVYGGTVLVRSKEGEMD